MRIGQIGIGHAHAAGKARVLRESNLVEFAGIFEPHPSAIATVRDQPAYAGVRWLSESEILEDRSIAGVFIETLPLENLRWARAALEAGKHVLVDKAPGVSLSELRGVLALAEERGLHVQMGYQFRFNPAFEFAINAFRSGLLGEIFKIEAEIPTSQRGYEERGRDVALYPGGTFYELACHFVDLVVALLGTPEKVTSILRADYHQGGQQPYIDNTLAVFEYDRAMAVIQSWAMGIEPSVHRRFEIYGTRGSIRVEPIEPPRLQLCLARQEGGFQGGWQEVAVGDRPRFVGDLEEFVAVASGQRPPLYAAAHDLAVQAALLRACGVGDE
ncbi:MAG TPA: Gfo/Idh/MocA family oxidoreductase [Chloroflexota bacterium]|nr:Gfo/Idh/MocA family oxidoreductase [Chloroflexota bacterium]